jgi:hypothetical protein
MITTKLRTRKGKQYLAFINMPGEEDEVLYLIKDSWGRGIKPYEYTFPEEFTYEDLIAGKVRFTSKGRSETKTFDMRRMMSKRL